MQIWRWSHTGRVCSGDFLSNKDDMTEEEQNKYTITEGTFIYVVLLVTYILFAIIGVVLLIVLCFTACKRGDQMKKESSDLFSAAVDDHVAEA